MDRTTSWHGRLYCQYFWIEAQLTFADGRWSARVETPTVPLEADGRTALLALVAVLEPFGGIAIELLHSAPPGLLRLLEGVAHSSAA
jgi:hypothetical protein